MFKRFVEVFICAPIFIICIIFNIIFVVSAIIWGPIYYVITGADPLTEDLTFFWYEKGDKLVHYILKKL